MPANSISSKAQAKRKALCGAKSPRMLSNNCSENCLEAASARLGGQQ